MSKGFSMPPPQGGPGKCPICHEWAYGIRGHMARAHKVRRDPQARWWACRACLQVLPPEATECRYCGAARP